MPSNDEIKPHNGDAVNDDVAGAMPVVHETSAAPDMLDRGIPPVSYTHLTLPTTPYV